jgi:hypothetical protein
MFKLIRLAIYGLVGYAIYQFVMDVIHTEEESKTPQRGRGKSGGRAGNARLTGAKRGGGSGKSVATEDSDGASTRHRVGRGVV